MAHVLQVFVLFVAIVLPFFEGCESATGLFVLHGITLATLVFLLLKSRQLWFPPLLGFLPFLVYLFVSVAIAPYKYSAMLQLWDWWFLLGLAFVFLNLMKDAPGLKQAGYAGFLLGTIALAISILVGWKSGRLRWRGTFMNPNDFGTYAVLLLLLGLFHLERVASKWQKRTVWFALAFLAVSIAMASSRAIFLGCVAGTAVFLWQRKPSRWIAVSTIVFLLLSSSILAYRIARYSDPFQYYRLKIWKSSLQGILQDPYLGIGLNMLPWNAARFNFPADVEVGRFGRVATSADNQYIQVLAETGFLGFFLFLIGWTTLFLLLKQLPRQFLILRYPPFIVLSIVCIFSLALENTAIVAMFTFLLMLPVAVSQDLRLSRFSPGKIHKAGIIAVVVAIFLTFVLAPYLADREFYEAHHASSNTDAEQHLQRAVKFNPYQPYYRFAAIKAAVDGNATLSPQQWSGALLSLDECIRLNPLESEFYVYRARINRILLFKTRDSRYLKEIVSAYESAAGVSPYNVFQRSEFAAFLTAIGQYEEAAKQLEQVLSMEPVYLNAQLLLTEVRFRQGRAEEANQLMNDLEQKEQRYTLLRTSTNEPYVRQLLAIDAARKEEVKKTIGTHELNS